MKDLKDISKTLIDFGIPLKGRISFETEDFINEIQKWDKNSLGFRYPYDTKGKKFFQGEFLIPSDFLRKINTLSNLKDIVLKVMEDLENIEGDFEQEKENKKNQADIA